VLAPYDNIILNESTFESNDIILGDDNEYQISNNVNEDDVNNQIKDDNDDDEWDDDDDLGYVLISITNEEFNNLEEAALREKSTIDRLTRDIESWEIAKDNNITNKSDNNINDMSMSSNSLYVNRDNDSDIIDIINNGKFSNITNKLFNKSSNSLTTSISTSSISKYYIDNNTDDDTNDNNLLRHKHIAREVDGQYHLRGIDGSTHSYFNLKVIFEPFTTGFEDKEYAPPKGTIIAGRYQVKEVLGQAAFSTALQCLDLESSVHANEEQWVCLKVIKNKKDFFDQSIDEIKLLQLINSVGDPDKYHVVRLIDYFYFKEHLFIVSELLKENLYEFGKYVRESNLEPYFTLPRLKKICRQVLEALEYVHSLNLIHSDLKPENIVIKSYSRCEVKLIDFGSSCFTTDYLSTYIQSRSYRAPEVSLGHPYDSRIDIWSLGAVAAEMYTGYVLFQNDSIATMLGRIVGILGPYPTHILENSRESHKYFTANNTIIYEKNENDEISLILPKKTTLEKRLHVDKIINESPNDDITEEKQFVNFVRELLLLDPNNRPIAKKALTHRWLQNAYDIDFTTIDSVYAAPLPPADEEDVDAAIDDSAIDESYQDTGDEDDEDAVFNVTSFEYNESNVLGSNINYNDEYDDEDSNDNDDNDMDVSYYINNNDISDSDLIPDNSINEIET